MSCVPEPNRLADDRCRDGGFVGMYIITVEQARELFPDLHALHHYKPEQPRVVRRTVGKFKAKRN